MTRRPIALRYRRPSPDDPRDDPRLSDPDDLSRLLDRYAAAVHTPAETPLARRVRWCLRFVDNVDLSEHGALAALTERQLRWLAVLTISRGRAYGVGRTRVNPLRAEIRAVLIRNGIELSAKDVLNHLRTRSRTAGSVIVWATDQALGVRYRTGRGEEVSDVGFARFKNIVSEERAKLTRSRQAQ